MRRNQSNKNDTKENNNDNKPTSGISLMKHNRLRVLSESSSSKIISSKNDLILGSNENFIYKKNITIAEKINQLKHNKYYLRKNQKYKNNTSSNNSIDTISSNSSSNNDISSFESTDTTRAHAPLIPAASYSVDIRNNNKNNTQHRSSNSLDSNLTDPSTLAQPIRQELQIKAKESISDIILACRSLIQTSNISNDLTKAAYNFSLLDSVISDIDNSITKINQNLNLCKQKDEELENGLKKLNEVQEDSRRVKDLVVAYITK
ncbi:hypothetical protein BCR32DRAFT_269444 [Anaeromyces robustus]|uniref:BLOC-1-related complex subunit 7 n=1 Tax=Anaeromyces robustus TaxID=1754192 RepID=A0A1Y1X1G5_9FUNG|nr:hypothetical protein BCR32DRAFT_269444 [Anaeromyces robustus]|eukprot:ORX79505.1 hypothetical protein BCR32DRAFT_269444 [Anaeromyces robustus]